MKLQIKIQVLFWMVAISLVLAPAALPAEGESPDLEALQQELAEARTELAEAAARLAEIHQQLALERGDPDWGRDFAAGFPRGLAGPDGTPHRFMMFHSDTAMGAQGSMIGVSVGGGSDAAQAGPGVPVLGVTPDGPAQQAGIRRGDRIMAVDGQDLGQDMGQDMGQDQAGNGAMQLRRVLGEIEPGSQVAVEVDRDGERLTFELETVARGRRMAFDLERLEEMLGRAGDNMEIHIERIREHAGEAGGPIRERVLAALPGFGPGLGRDVQLIANHPGLEPYFGTAGGVLVARISDDNPLGLKSGDVILRINDEAVERPVDIGRSLMRLEPDAEVHLDVVREGRDRRLEGRVPDRRLGWAGTSRLSPSPVP